MQNDVGICGVGLMTMAQPIGGFQMQFDVACQLHSINSDTRIDKIGAGIGAVLSRTDHLQIPSICGNKLLCPIEPELPDVMQ
jgi:hypothetical protein